MGLIVLSPDTKQVEIERAWIAHDPSRASIPASVRRQVRAFKQSLAGPAAVAARSLVDPALRKHVLDFSRKRGIGRARAFARLKGRFPGARFSAEGDTIQIFWLEPRDRSMLLAVRDPGELQPAVLVNFCVAGRRTPRATALLNATALECPDHALGRILQRMPGADLRSILIEGAEVFLWGDAAAVLELTRAGRTLHLSTKDGGMFLADGIHAVDSAGQQSLHARPRTWISREMVGRDQIPVPTAKDADASIFAAVQLMCEAGPGFEVYAR
jgi:hypothetical protein